MRKPTPLPPPLDKSAFTLKDGRLKGLSRSRLRGGAVVKTGHGMRAPANLQLDHPARVRPYTRINPSSFASHGTAALLWDFPESAAGYSEHVIHITRPTGSARVRRDDVVSHRAFLPPEETTQLAGINLTTRARSWLDLAAYLPLDDLVVIADHLLRVPRPEFEGRHEAYAGMDELRSLLARHPKKRGIRPAREALMLARVGADSPPETRLRLAMLRAGLPEPLVNQPIVDRDGKAWHPADLSIPQFRLAIEYEGKHHSHPDQVVKDVNRAENTEAAGWDEVRISKRHMRDDARPAIAKIVKKLTEKGWKGAAGPA